MAEVLFEAQFDPRSLHAETHDAPPAPSTSTPGFTRAQLQGATAPELPPGTLPRSPEQYRALLGRLFDGRAQESVDLMLKEPVLRSMREVWRVGHPETNRKVATEFMRYFLPKFGEAYGYRPCPVEFNDTLSGGYNGLYDLKHDRIYLPQRSLAGSFRDFVDVLVHEQTHCFQERLMYRQHVAVDGVPLTADERAIATYWRNEQPKYRSAMANGSEMSPETRKRYREIGQEYHAITTGAFVGDRLTQA